MNDPGPNLVGVLGGDVSPAERAANREVLIENAQSSARERARRTTWQCLICKAVVPMHYERSAPRKRNRACPKCRRERADDVADLRLGLRFE